MNSADAKIHIYAWPERFLYLGPSTKTSPHRNHAATWLIAREGKSRVTLSSGEHLENQVIYLPSEGPLQSGYRGPYTASPKVERASSLHSQDSSFDA